jgi:hypothetical protein
MAHRSRRSVAFLFPLLTAGTGFTDPLPDDGPAERTCLQPAPLYGSFDPAAPGFIVVFRDGVPAAAEAARLSARYCFQPKHVYQFALLGFSAELEPAALASIRCEASVRYVEHDGVATAGSVAKAS